MIRVYENSIPFPEEETVERRGGKHMGCCNQADQEKYAELKKFIDSLPTQ